MTRIRQLTAIMFTHIEGYQALVQQEEAMADEYRRQHRKVFKEFTDKFRGKHLPYPGDGTLSIFSSTVEAVQCAIEMQLAFQREMEIPVRIGIHLGDIIYSEEEAIGEGVQVASRIECNAVPGSVLISRKVYDEIKNHPEIQSRFLHSCKLEGIENPMDIYAISNEGIVVPEQPDQKGDLVALDTDSQDRLLAFWNELKRRKVVRVVSLYAAGAFVALELSNNIVEPLNLPDWTTRVVIILLAVGFIVTAVLSWIYDFTPQGIKRTKPLIRDGKASLPDLMLKSTEELVPDSHRRSWFARNKVLRRYVLPILVFAALFILIRYWDTWFEFKKRVDKEAVMHVNNAKIYLNNNADPSIVKGELDLALTIEPDYPSAYYTYALVHLFLESDTVNAKQKLHRTVALDPDFSHAWNTLAVIASWEDSLQLTTQYTIRAVETDPSNAFAAYSLASLSHDRGLFSEALTWYRKAIAMDSTFVEAFSALGALYNEMSRPYDAIIELNRSLRISPESDKNYVVFKNLAEAHFYLHEFSKAFEYLEQSKKLNPDFAETEKCFARYYETTGDTLQSVQHWRRYLVLEIDSTAQAMAQWHLDSLRVQYSQ